MLLLKNILSLLQKNEKQKMLQLIILDVFISLLDIFFLIALLIVIDFYTGSGKLIITNSRFSETLKQQPLLLIGVFALLFALKNWFAVLVSKKQFYFIYENKTIIDKKTKISLLRILYPETNIDKIKFKNSCKLDFRASNIEIIDEWNLFIIILKIAFQKLYKPSYFSFIFFNWKTKLQLLDAFIFWRNLLNGCYSYAYFLRKWVVKLIL